MDYHKIGLKVGLEIHQQLEGKKLFCTCPTVIRDDEPHFTLARKMRAVAGESGNIDIAAEHEHKRERTFHYQGYHDSNCLVEIDAEPPHDLNPDAFRTALQFSKITHASVPSIIQAMRKTVVDGSNTSGFQRTALIARNGKIESSLGTIGITNISLEEDSCRNIADDHHSRTYRLDRLGIPLIEIGTSPDIKSPEQCQEAAKKLGMLLRSLPGVKRGLGTIRQDVNISVVGGERIEIKGAQDLRQLPLLVELEAQRQVGLLSIKNELKAVRLEKLNIIDVTEIFKNSSSSIIQKTIQKKGTILALKLNGFAGFIGKELQPNRRLGTEFSERAKIKAGVGGIFHSDELPNYGMTDRDCTEVKKKLHCAQNDAFVLVEDTKEKSEMALYAVYDRAQEVLKGIPQEVRKANADGTTSYLRPIPGAARMYPETDVPLLYPDLSAITLPELLEEKIRRFQQKLGLAKDLAEFIAKSEKIFLFEELIEQYPSIKPAFVAETLTSTLLDIKRQHHLDAEQLTDDNFRKLFRSLAENKIHKDIVIDVLIDMIQGKFDVKKYETLGTEKIHDVLRDLIRKNKSAPFSALMGLAMKELQGKASGKFIADELKKLTAVQNQITSK